MAIEAVPVRDEETLTFGEHAEGDIWWDATTRTKYTGFVVEYHETEEGRQPTEIEFVVNGVPMGPFITFDNGRPSTFEFSLPWQVFAVSFTWDNEDRLSRTRIRAFKSTLATYELEWDDKYCFTGRATFSGLDRLSERLSHTR